MQTLPGFLSWFTLMWTFMFYTVYLESFAEILLTVGHLNNISINNVTNLKCWLHACCERSYGLSLCLYMLSRSLGGCAPVLWYLVLVFPRTSDGCYVVLSYVVLSHTCSHLGSSMKSQKKVKIGCLVKLVLFVMACCSPLLSLWTKVSGSHDGVCILLLQLSVGSVLEAEPEQDLISVPEWRVLSILLLQISNSESRPCYYLKMVLFHLQFMGYMCCVFKRWRNTGGLCWEAVWEVVLSFVTASRCGIFWLPDWLPRANQDCVHQQSWICHL